MARHTDTERARDRSALLLVDVQNDYLSRSDLAPSRAVFLDGVARVLARVRSVGMPVAHIHTCVAMDGSNRMPHQRGHDVWCCIEGTPGAEAPDEARPTAGEKVFAKTVYDPFSNPDLAAWLTAENIEFVLIAGVNMHACVREAALGAYQRGFRVALIEDAVASYDPLHSELTRNYLEARHMPFVRSDTVFGAEPGQPEVSPGHRTSGALEPVSRWTRRNPSRLDAVLGVVTAATTKQVDDAVTYAHRAQGQWAALRPEVRGEILTGIADALEGRAGTLADALVRDIGKPLTEARAEVARAIELARVAIRVHGAAHPWEHCADDVLARRVPIGTVAAITPFNHALGIPIGKLFPALALGNAVIWKPSIFGAAVAELVVEAFSASKLPLGLVGLLHGDGNVAQQLARHSGVEAVSITASETAGRQIALACAAQFKPVQAELGGNNAVVVMHDADIPAIASVLARAAFGFAGQRCTAGRRILVVREREAELLQAMEAATRALAVGAPANAPTEVGPLVSAEARDAIAAVVTRAREGGAGLVCGGCVPPGLDHGAWYAPTLLCNIGPETRIFREESFGPVALVTAVRDFDEALNLVNAVSQGLVATLYSDDTHLQQRFLTGARAGVLKINYAPSGVHAEAPFGGWKSSGMGPPEHGRWDAEFYPRVQAIYGITDLPLISTPSPG